jgi:hypothetical protein
MPAGGPRLMITLADKAGRRMANGVYLYLITVRGINGETITSEVRKLVLLR